ncbi:MAG TPA: Ni/Fe-hydrogenase cytochrome b subunit [Candidatus Methylomirabilis sp.]|nr:Ni/Fe-hydrogenase cytochrome b subunit [Candidatus Methylomirabilis sp.]
MSEHDTTGAILVNHWQRGVPVYNEPVITRTQLFFAALAALGLGLAFLRFFSPLGPFSGMNDAYAWGIWKSFNVMTLTALGSGPLAVGMAAWVFNRQRLHVVMRTALVTGFLFYATGLLALGFDVGRAWNFWNILLPWRWNAHSAMLEVAVCMPLYCAVFLAFENLPMVLERFYYTGSDATRVALRRAAPFLRRIYPFAITGAYVLPLMHQSSLGGLLLLAGDKIHPIWQTPFLPLLYLLAAGVAGLGFVTFVLLITCLHYSRPLDLEDLEELGNLLSWVCFVFLVVRFGDLAWRGQLGAAFALDKMSLAFLAETALILVPAVVLRSRSARETPRTLLNMATLACLGGTYYRFVPTTIAFKPGRYSIYFPSLPEVLIALGYIALAVTAFAVVVKYFAVLPASNEVWNDMFRFVGRRRLAGR